MPRRGLLFALFDGVDWAVPKANAAADTFFVIYRKLAFAADKYGALRTSDVAGPAGDAFFLVY